MKDQIEHLRLLDKTLIGLLQRTAGDSTGVCRAMMRPSYSSWRVIGTRPASDRGVTFHFRHTFITKGRHNSQSWQEITTAAKHQAYIERPSALEREEGDPLDLGPPTPTPVVRLPKTRRPPSESAESLGLCFPETTRTPGVLSFGTIGSDKAMRSDFWRKVEAAEGRRGRVQCRIILELPHEADQMIRFRIARDFARIFEEKGLPYWCAIHAPSKHNDPRNWHLHIAYHDRPARRTPDGRWDFEIEETYQTASRSRRTYYPHRQTKDREAQGRAWILSLRRRYADIANFYLSAAGIEKRYDPRPYRESGILKQATRHLGTRAGIVETYGIETQRGTENLRREVDFRLSQGVIRLRTRNAEADAIARRLDGLIRLAPDLVEKDVREGQAHLAEARAAALEEARLRQEEEAHRIAAEAVLLRLEQRTRFLDRESERLLLHPPPEVAQDAVWKTAQILLEERRLALKARPGLEEFATEALARAAEVGEAAARAGAMSERAIQAASEAEARSIEKIGRAYGLSTAQIADAQAAIAIANVIARHTATLMPEDLSTHQTEKKNVSEEKISLSKESLSPHPSSGFSEQQHLTTHANLPPISPNPKAPFKENHSVQNDTPLIDQKSPAAHNAPGSAGSEPLDPESQALAVLFGTMPTRRAQPQDDPDAFFLSSQPTAAEIQSLQEKVRSLGNQELRRRAIATRDAADLTEDIIKRRGYLAAWYCLREIARKRGLDLDTGQYDPRRAIDPSESVRHTERAIFPPEEPRIPIRERTIT